MAGARPELIVVAGPDEGRRVILMNNVALAGRSAECEVYLPEPYISRRQLQFTLTHDGWTVENLSKGAPLVIEGKKFKPGRRILLGSGDVISVGSETKLLFVDAHDNPRTVLQAYRQVQPAPPDPAPEEAPAEGSELSGPETPPPAATPVEADVETEYSWDEPAVVAPPAEDEEEPSEDEKLALRQRSKMRKVGIGAGVYVVLMIVLFFVILPKRKDESDDESRGAPAVLTSQQIQKAFSTPLERPPSPQASAEALHEARSMHHQRTRERHYLYRCVKSYRLFLAYRMERQRFFDPEDEIQYKQALRELSEKTYALYYDAVLREWAKEWDTALAEFRDIFEMVPIPEAADDSEVDRELIQNVQDHIRYVSRHLAKQKKR
jgi:hypothetical protein